MGLPAGVRGKGAISKWQLLIPVAETGGVSVSKKKLPVVRDEDMESLYGVSVESVSTFYDNDLGNLVVVGELAASNGVLEDEYREVQVVIHDAEGDIVGRGLSNWVSFGLRQSFELSFSESDDLYGIPSSVSVYPASSFAVTAAVQDSEFVDPTENPNHGQELFSVLGRATVGHERLAHIAECFSHERTPSAVASLCTKVSLTFMSDDLDEVARLLGVQPSCLSQTPSFPIAVLDGDLRADADVNGQIAALLSRTTDDLDDWRELVEQHSADLSVDITTSGWTWSLAREIVLAMAERNLGFGGWIDCCAAEQGEQ